jgi:hypothetical protein
MSKGRDTVKMHRFLPLGILLLAGCQNLVGPLQCRTPKRVDDPCLSTYEQERRGRDRLALPVNSPIVAPPAVQLPDWNGNEGERP